jgi:hypothetical protein
MDHITRDSIGAFRMTCISDESLDDVMDTLDSRGVVRYEIDSCNIRSKATLLAELKLGFALDLDGPLESWDTAADLIWQMLVEQEGRSAVLIWRNVQMLFVDNLQLFFDAIDLLLGVSESVERRALSSDCHAVSFRMLLIGVRAGFLPLQ